jgi:hypothetical protein
MDTILPVQSLCPYKSTSAKSKHDWTQQCEQEGKIENLLFNIMLHVNELSSNK